MIATGVRPRIRMPLGEYLSSCLRVETSAFDEAARGKIYVANI